MVWYSLRSGPNRDFDREVPFGETRPVFGPRYDGPEIHASALGAIVFHQHNGKPSVSRTGPTRLLNDEFHLNPGAEQDALGYVKYGETTISAPILRVTSSQIYTEGDFFFALLSVRIFGPDLPEIDSTNTRIEGGARIIVPNYPVGFAIQVGDARYQCVAKVTDVDEDPIVLQVQKQE